MNFRKSALQVFANTAQTVAQNGIISFPNVAVKTGCSIKNLTNTTIELAPGGLYEVSVTITGAQSATAGDLIVQLFRNGVAVPQALAIANSAEATDVETMTFSALILVNPSCCAVDNTTTLTVVNTGVAAIYSNTAISVVKLA